MPPKQRLSRKSLIKMHICLDNNNNTPDTLDKMLLVNNTSVMFEYRIEYYRNYFICLSIVQTCLCMFLLAKFIFSMKRRNKKYGGSKVHSNRFRAIVEAMTSKEVQIQCKMKILCVRFS